MFARKLVRKIFDTYPILICLLLVVALLALPAPAHAGCYGNSFAFVGPQFVPAVGFNSGVFYQPSFVANGQFLGAFNYPFSAASYPPPLVFSNAFNTRFFASYGFAPSVAVFEDVRFRRARSNVQVNVGGANVRVFNGPFATRVRIR